MYYTYIHYVTNTNYIMILQDMITAGCRTMGNLRTKIMDLRGFDSSSILIPRGGILMSIGDLQEGLSQAILVGIIVVGRLGVSCVYKYTCYTHMIHEDLNEELIQL